ncbi:MULTISPECIES: formate dehydrogenase accessory sulfurtransferase FdhD [Desulfobacula]|uniref:Sulfur carrier protein FdhD n=2 Tax=Desulfobacula TaxID=28222 RepID=K0NCW9_DESTT|nr:MULTISPECIES: formate dehydrogenase accessory sulfurtransferase FdhD [Desulfobacula]CCK78540.1 BamL: formate dehydrogenase, subunit D [Desulfobacula toluolica Tol2]SDU52243.1 FdhD protein [Desulfobacula phenolica]
MSAGKNTTFYQALHCNKKGVCQIDSIELIGEEPLMIRVEDKPYSVVMRTPGEEVFHAAGICLGEGIVDSPDDFKTIGHDINLDPNIVDIWLTPERKKKIPDLLKRKSYISQTSCGICGKQLIKDLHQVLIPAEDGFKVDIEGIFNCVKMLSKKQNYYPRTRGSHAALLFDDQLEILTFAEDVGRHNALDKAIGKAFMDRTLSKASLLVLSSRISYELVQKAARAHLPMIISKSRPTALAVQMGQSLNMTLACAFEGSKLLVLCGEDRIIKK